MMHGVSAPNPHVIRIRKIESSIEAAHLVSADSAQFGRKRQAATAPKLAQFAQN
jgi:hypothetical protein